MKFLKRLLLMPFLLALVAIAPTVSMAAGTVSGTNVDNTAVINFKVNGVDQTAVQNTVTFKVDDKVSLTVVANDAGAVTTYPGSNVQAMKFTVTNTGNTVHDFAVTETLLAGATLAGQTVAFYEDTNSNGAYNSGVDNALPISGGKAYLDELAVDGSKVVFLVVTVPLTATNGQAANYRVTAEAYQGGGASALGALTKTQADADKLIADVPGTVQIVLADAAGDGDVAVDGKVGKDGTTGFSVSAANLTVTKTSAVYSDPVNGTVNPKAIPGAVVTYTITISNGAGAASATNVAITDSLNTEITATHLTFLTQYNDGVTACAAGEGIVVAAVCKTNAADADNGDWNVTGANTVTVTGLTLNAGDSVTAKFQVTVQ